MLDELLAVCMTIVRWAMFFIPFAVFGLTAKLISEVGFSTLLGLSAYVGTVSLGLLILMIFYYLLIFIFSQGGVKTFIVSMAPLQLLALSTSSSAAVMPLSIQTAEQKLRVPASISELIIPLGATMNMAGTAIYQAIAIVFLAQMSAVHLDMSELAMIVMTVVASSIGAPGTPGVGVVILGAIATQFGIPTYGIVLIMGVDRILDMLRTVVNVTGDLTAATLIGQGLD